MSFCAFDATEIDGGRYECRCRLCGRFVVTTTPNVTAACKASADYAETHRRIAGVAGGTTGGPGTELKALLKDWLGFVHEPGCACEDHARQMDLWGPDECERRMDEIVGWLREEHARRRDAGQTKLPWTDFGATQLVRLACRRARAKASA